MKKASLNLCNKALNRLRCWTLNSIHYLVGTVVSTDINLFQSATFYNIYLYSLPVIFSKKESETVILKIIRYRHLFVYGLDRGLGFQTSKSKSESESLACKSESKCESIKTGLEPGLESISGLQSTTSKHGSVWLLSGSANVFILLSLGTVLRALQKAYTSARTQRLDCGAVCDVESWKCPPGYACCEGSHQCTYKSMFCNGINNCRRGTDESPTICRSKPGARFAYARTFRSPSRITSPRQRHNHIHIYYNAATRILQMYRRFASHRQPAYSLGRILSPHLRTLDIASCADSMKLGACAPPFHFFCKCLGTGVTESKRTASKQESDQPVLTIIKALTKRPIVLFRAKKCVGVRPKKFPALSDRCPPLSNLFWRHLT